MIGHKRPDCKGGRISTNSQMYKCLVLIQCLDKRAYMQNKASQFYILLYCKHILTSNLSRKFQQPVKFSFVADRFTEYGDTA